MIAIAAVFALLLVPVVCVSLSELLQMKHRILFERICGHGGVVGLVLIPGLIGVVCISLVLLPFSFLADRRKWKKNTQ